jgi:hypothetical protein
MLEGEPTTAACGESSGEIEASDEHSKIGNILAMSTGLRAGEVVALGLLGQLRLTEPEPFPCGSNVSRQKLLDVLCIGRGLHMRIHFSL